MVFVQFQTHSQYKTKTTSHYLTSVNTLQLPWKHNMWQFMALKCQLIISSSLMKQVAQIITYQMPSEADNPKQNNQNHQRMLHWWLQYKNLHSLHSLHYALCELQSLNDHLSNSLPHDFTSAPTLTVLRITSKLTFLFITVLHLCCLSVKRVDCDKVKAPSERSSIMTNRKSPMSFPMSLRWTVYVALNPQRGPQKLIFFIFRIKMCFSRRKSATKFVWKLSAAML